MKLHNIFDEIFSRWSNIAVLRALNNYAVGISGREVSRIANLAIKNCFNALNDLENVGIVKRVRGGRDHLFTLNRDHFIVKTGLIPLFDVEKKFFDVVISDIKKKLKSTNISVYIFGSVVRKEEEVDSDLDICIIYENKNQREEIIQSVSELNSLLYKKYFVSLSHFLITKKEFFKRLNQNKNIVHSIVKEGILLIDNLNLKQNNVKDNKNR